MTPMLDLFESDLDFGAVVDCLHIWRACHSPRWPRLDLSQLHALADLKCWDRHLLWELDYLGPRQQGQRLLQHQQLWR